MSYQKDCFTFSIILGQEYPTVKPYRMAEGLTKLLPLANKYQRLALAACERDLSTSEKIELDEALEQQMIAVNRKYFDGLLVIHLQDDPRGATVKLELPSGTSNSFGDRLFCLPIR
jgi:hypothetical protein